MEPAGSESLRDYRGKRDPSRTTEPFSAEPVRSPTSTEAGRFVVHLHRATRTHYDLRLEGEGALLSFAVPKGPSLDPEEKRLAIRTENHPLEYVDFEDVIPEGNYGAGPMIVWDTGVVHYLEQPAEPGLASGKLDFELHGFKLRGRFALVETGSRRAERGKQAEPHWLLIKKSDAHARPGEDVLEQEPRSVLSGLTVDELADRPRLAKELERAAAETGAPVGDVDAARLVPQPCSTEEPVLSGKAWLYELKLDGARIVADKRADEVTLRYRKQRPATASFPEIVRAVRALAPDRLVLDGEVVAFDDAGRPSFQKLARRFHATRPREVRVVAADVPVVYAVFDLLQLGDRDLRNLPLIERKALLQRLVAGKGRVRVLDHLEGDGRPLLELCQKQQLEGVVAKRREARYREGPERSPDWVKIKLTRDDEFVVVAWVESRSARSRIGALEVASRAGTRWLVRGRVGSGMSAALESELHDLLKPLAVDESVAEGGSSVGSRARQPVRPELVVSVEYQGWSEDGHLRFPVLRGIRPDVSPSDCTAAPGAELIERVVELHRGTSIAAERAPRVELSNQSKVFWPDEGYTKGDLCDYYASVADVMLPWLEGRPVVLVRYPDGIAGKNFYQWNVPEHAPDWVRTLRIRDEEHDGKTVTTFLVDDVDTLVYIANLGCIPLHVLAGRERSLDHCDFLAVDFDPGDAPFTDAVRLALALRELLDELGLEGFPKTSGQAGLHVLVPVGPGVKYPVAKTLTELLGRLLEQRHPDMATTERRVGARGRRVYVDTGQTGRSRTIVAPYSVRAHAGATVSTPLTWDEVHLALDPRRFNIDTVPDRIAETGDPLRGMLQRRPDMVAAVSALERLVAG